MPYLIVIINCLNFSSNSKGNIFSHSCECGVVIVWMTMEFFVTTTWLQLSYYSSGKMSWGQPEVVQDLSLLLGRDGLTPSLRRLVMIGNHYWFTCSVSFLHGS